MTLTQEQKRVCDLRLQENQHSDYATDIRLSSSVFLQNFCVHKNVLRPEKSSGLYLAQYLVTHPSLYEKKSVLDMGCGSGLQGIVCGLYGASRVTFSDVMSECSTNTKANVHHFDLDCKSDVLTDDLFEHISEKFDVIVFNHPFFAAKPSRKHPVTKAWLDKGTLLQRFLREAPAYLQPNGYIIMPFFEDAGVVNNPRIQGLKHGYEITTLFSKQINDENLQKGLFSVYRLTK